jgi:hypothetical protein
MHLNEELPLAVELKLNFNYHQISVLQWPDNQHNIGVSQIHIVDS